MIGSHPESRSFSQSRYDDLKLRTLTEDVDREFDLCFEISTVLDVHGHDGLDSGLR